MKAFPHAEGVSDHFEEIIDVAIVGYGFAGGMTAIASAKAGRQAIIFEKIGRSNPANRKESILYASKMRKPMA